MNRGKNRSSKKKKKREREKHVAFKALSIKSSTGLYSKPYYNGYSLPAQKVMLAKFTNLKKKFLKLTYFILRRKLVMCKRVICLSDLTK